MSLFSLRQWWRCSCGSREEFTGNSLCVGNLDQASDGTGVPCFRLQHCMPSGQRCSAGVASFVVALPQIRSRQPVCKVLFEYTSRLSVTLVWRTCCWNCPWGSLCSNLRQAVLWGGCSRATLFRLHPNAFALAIPLLQGFTCSTRGAAPAQSCTVRGSASRRSYWWRGAAAASDLSVSSHRRQHGRWALRSPKCTSRYCNKCTGFSLGSWQYYTLYMLAGGDHLCVQSMDGQLSFFANGTCVFECFLPGFLIPGPLCCCPATDSLVTTTSSLGVQGFKFATLAAGAGHSPPPTGPPAFPSCRWNNSGRPGRRHCPICLQAMPL